MDKRDREALEWEIKTAQRELDGIEIAHANAVAEYERVTTKLKAMLTEKRHMRGDHVPVGSLADEDLANAPAAGRRKKS